MRAHCVHDVGGIAGSNSGSIASAYVAANVTASVAGAANIGGLVGSHAPASSSTSIFDSYATGAVTADASGVGPVGGLVGNNTGTIDGIWYAGSADSSAFMLALSQVQTP